MIITISIIADEKLAFLLQGIWIWEEAWMQLDLAHAAYANR